MMKKFLGIFCMALLSAGCCLVDEDRTDCPEKDYDIDYEMRLVTNVQTEINTVLGLEENVNVAAALRQHLSGIFSDLAHDIDLSFYDVDKPMVVLEHIADIINANQTSYTLQIPVREYMHLAVANIAQNNLVSLRDAELCNTSHLYQNSGDGTVIDSHNTGLFSARLPMNIRADIDQDFLVTLYMANCATALVIDETAAPEISGFSAFTTGFADSFNIADSTYTYNVNPLVRANNVPVENDTESCWATVQFPSREEPPATKVVVETTDPFLSFSAEETIWEWIVYVTLPDGSITETRLGIKTPLRAGQLKIIRVRLLPDGGVVPFDSNVAVSVQLNWQNAGEHIIDL